MEQGIINKLIQRFTKMGYAGNDEPNFVIPTCIADYVDKVI